MRRSTLFAAAGSVAFAAAGGFGTAAVVSGSSPKPPTKTVTINVATGPLGPRGPAGPAGPAGPQGPAGGFECIAGYSPGILVINTPQGHTDVYTCLKD